MPNKKFETRIDGTDLIIWNILQPQNSEGTNKRKPDDYSDVKPARFVSQFPPK